jgi:thioredoxin-dependent peroxiredoxin
MTASLIAMLLGATSLKVGDKAPDFTLLDQDGKSVSLSDALKSGPVILAFYPKAFTPGCTRQNSNFRDKYAEVEKKGAQVFGISTDSVETQRKFKAEYKLPYELLSDPDGKVAKQYPGTMALIGVAGRANFVIAQDGTISQIVEGSDAIDPNSAIAACPLRHQGA